MKIADEIRNLLRELVYYHLEEEKTIETFDLINATVKEILKLIDKENKAMRRIREGELQIRSDGIVYNGDLHLWEEIESFSIKRK